MAPENRVDSPLRQRRKARGMKLKDLAEAAGVSAGMASMVENGYVPKAAKRERIAGAVDASVRELWPDLEDQS